MIENISLKDIASYDPNDGVQLNDLKKLNFFFGFNGSGKSTIAKYLYNLSLSDNEKSADFTSCSQNGFDSANEQILVFDENFTEINFIRNPLLNGVFSLNQQNGTIDSLIKNQEELIKANNKEKEKKIALKVAIEADKNKKKKDLLDFCWSQRNTFSTFSKISLPYSGSKPNHLNKLEQALQSSLGTVPTIQILTEEYRQLFEKDLSEVETSIKRDLYKQIRHTERELGALLDEIIIGNEDVDISALIKTLNSRNWVEIGVEFLKKTDSICPFCQQKTINEDLSKQFNELFDETYKKKIEQITIFLSKYKEKTSSLVTNILKIQNSYNQDNISSNLYVKLQKLFESNHEIIEDKLKNPNERKELISIVTLKSDLSKIIQMIKENNKTFAELGGKRQILIKDIWKFIASKCQGEIESFNNKKHKYLRIYSLADELIEEYKKNIISSKESIENLRSQSVNTKEAVDNINLILKTSGYESFEIAEKDSVNNISQYYLKRPNSTVTNSIFKSLSEGEKSFISFLYFYQLCVGTDDILNNGSKKKILVIDDPVSSLDSQALFVVSSLAHQLILRKGDDNRPNKKCFKNENISQVFIFTHNIYFYKEVSFDKRPMCTDYWHYKVNKINNKTSITGQYNKTVHDDYSMLWQTTKELKANITQDTKLNVIIANTMRRIIESYVNFIGLGKDSWSSILDANQNSPEYYLKCAFISTINDESHKVSALDSIYYQKLSSEQPVLLFNVFKEIFREIGKEHYEMLMEEQIDN